MAQNKPPAAKAGDNRGRTPAQIRKKPASKGAAESAMGGRIRGILLVSAGAFLVFCALATDAGVIGAAARDAVLRLFGTSGRFFLAFFIALHGIALLAGYAPFRGGAGRLPLYTLLLCCLVMLGMSRTDFSGLKFSDPALYPLIWDTPCAGGFVGHYFAKLASALFSAAGAWLLLSLISAAAIWPLALRPAVLAVARAAQRRRDEAGERKKQEVHALMAESAALAATGKRASRQVKDPFTDPSALAPAIRISPPDFDTAEAGQASPPSPKAASRASKSRQASAVPAVAPAAQAGGREKALYQTPPLSLLDSSRDPVSASRMQQEVIQNAALLEKILKDFSIEASVSEVSVGPTVTRYELQLKAGIRVSRVVNLADDIAMSLAALSVRIEAPIPGKSAIGVEVPNKEKQIVRLSQIISSDEFNAHPSPLAVALGKNLTGRDLIPDITSMPHLLIAGATGSGKSVCINAIIMSILYHSPPEDVRMILIDPKMVELSVYNEIPHLLIPVVTDPKDAAGALGWAVREMTRRYEVFVEHKVRGVDSYNQKMLQEGQEKMPHIILIIDELNDLMIVSAQAVETSIIRLSQLARAAGIHLVLATQRPTVNVITGVIKANIPTRISFAVMSQVDSRTILDMSGAEKLLGKGDMLYLPPDQNSPIRAQCSYVSDKEIEKVVAFVKKKQTADYDESVMEGIKVAGDPSLAAQDNGAFADEMLPKAMEIAFEKNAISTSTVQRRLRLGYARAGRIIDEMEERGYVSAADGSKPRKVLITREEYYAGRQE